MDVVRAAEEHVALFNESVRSRDFGAFVATFTEDAVMRFVGPAVGPFAGRGEIAQAYAAQPPDDTLSVHSVEPLDGSTARVRFTWDAGGDGSMVIRWRGGQVAELEIVFD